MTGTTSGSARLLNITQPAATQALQHAELQQGYPLFRFRRRCKLTPIGVRTGHSRDIARAIALQGRGRTVGAGCASGQWEFRDGP